MAVIERKGPGWTHERCPRPVGAADAGGRGGLTQRASAGPFGRVFQAGRDMVVYGAEDPYRLRWWRPRGSPPSAAEARAQPSLLLRVSSETVPFTGREAELAGLREWRDRRAALSVRLVHGPGGQGKSRLAAQAARLWSADGWTVLTALHRHDPAAPPEFAPGDLRGARGLLVVADYAERWDVADLLRMLSDLRGAEGPKVRVLLLARPAGTWWQTLAHRMDADLGLEAGASALDALETGAHGRGRLFEEARDRYAALLDVPGAHLVTAPEAVMEDDGYGQVLAVHMAALAAVLAHEEGARAPRLPAEVSMFLLSRERVHWEELHRGLLSTGADVMGQAVYTAALTGGLPRAEAVEALVRAEVESASHPGQIIKDHAVCYPPPPGSPGVLRPLYPDRLGEDFVALTTPGHGHPYPSDPWAADAAERLLGAGGQAWTRSAMTVLVETARRWPHIRDGQLYPLLRVRPELAVQAGGAALTALAELPELDPVLLDEVEALLPERRDVDLDPGVAAITRRWARQRLGRAPEGDGVLADRALTLTKLTSRLIKAGLYKEAGESAREAVAAYRRLAERRSGEHLSDLSGALVNLGICQAHLGMRPEALEATEEGVEIDRRLAESGSAASLENLASSLNNLGNRLADLGHRDRALEAAWESVRIRRRLAEHAPPRYLAKLAGALDNLGNRLAGLGGTEDAVAATGEAVELYRRLAADDRAAHVTDLGIALTNLSALLEQTGKAEEALEAGDDAVRVRRELAEADPAAFSAGLAAALCTRSDALAALRRHSEAMRDLEEALELFRSAAPADPAAVRRDLAAALCKFGVRLMEKGRHAEAANALDEGVGLYRPIAAAHPGVFGGEFTMALRMRLAAHLDGGADGEALRCAADYAEHLLPLARRLPWRFRRELDETLAAAVLLLGRTGRLRETVTMRQRLGKARRTGDHANAVEMLRRIAGPGDA
ncbi:tetratricopeptide repeat protein [Actinomadura sp. WMMA1423]|uniref:tetratricopeptide repeat protein n=1 Tax=Actinomadura sp. WMMA1423 TaxID=2591108 RepID=UPI00114668AA|nr:tetratricopeptide repeat protein [Actinomadura sp. WMMA1423]